MDHALVWQVQSPPSTLRAHVRQLLRAILAHALGMADDALVVDFTAGQAPRVNANWHGRPIAISLSHVDDWAWLAICPGRRAGIDATAIAALPDWQSVARLYLGPTRTQQLAAHSADTRDSAYAMAWSELEARGKCLGLGLQEFTPEVHARLHAPAIQCSAWVTRHAPSGPAYAIALALAPA